MAAPKFLSASLDSLTGSDNATGSLTCYFDIGMTKAPLEVISNYNFTPSLTIASASATSLSALAWYPTDDCTGTTVYNSGSGGTVLNGTLGDGAGNNEPAWDCSSGTGSLNYTTNDWVDYGTDAAWDVMTDPWTVSLWFNPTTLVYYGGLWSKKGPAMGTSAYVIMLVHNTNGSLGFYTPSNGWQWSNTGAIATGAWYHCVWSFDGSSTLSYYVNGVAEGTDTISITDNATMKVYTGAWLGSSYSSNGRIDNISFFTQALSAAEILEIYNKGIDGNPIAPPTNSSLTVTGIDTSQGYILDVNSNIVDDASSLSCVPNSASLLVASGRNINNDSTFFKAAGDGLNRTRIISRKPGVISNWSAAADRTTTITESLTVKYFQRVWDIDNSQWCYYTQTSINPAPGTTDTQPNNSGNITSASVVQIIDIY